MTSPLPFHKIDETRIQILEMNFLRGGNATGWAKRIGGAWMLAALISLRPSHATAWYVSATGGSNSNTGQANAPLATLQNASGRTNPGDTVLVMNGTYGTLGGGNPLTITRSGTAQGWIVYRAFPGHAPLIRFDSWQGINISASYIEVSGFRLQGNNSAVTLPAALNQPGSCNNPGGTVLSSFNGNAIGADGRNGNHPHHIRILNNEIFQAGAGVSLIQCDYVTVEGNDIYDNCWYTIYGGSGISLWQLWNFDGGTGYRNVIRGNRSHGNRLYVPWVGQCQITDGNGIIIDDSRNTQNGSTNGAYAGGTLVANNVVYNNGGSGIHTYLSDRVDIFHNTAYMNSQSVEINAGEIHANSSGNIRIANNILFAATGENITSNFANVNCVYQNNLYFGGSQASPFGTASIRLDPLFVSPSLNPAAADFRLQAGSPALNAADPAFSVPTDILGTARPQGTGADVGAYEMAASLPTHPLKPRIHALVRSESNKTFDGLGRKNNAITSPTVRRFRSGR